ncbi:conjugative relaxase-like TrwC/TraI family protein [Amycolatopsis lexingtonensis]|uniref:Conjugative relaxase-like TrwC/TraI family protein n=1 Tax=Amycolatopsis lexingtonensis TaxID=218822 RepID=A0ABR9HQG9_9PSEU|nr:MobF family relaxase [Amycolatopsis lexingtonensis]MBE1493183.1 conjugative relaxase-like TrwC/TraI family protein [Amycolatopsis lexingtonensis]
MMGLRKLSPGGHEYLTNTVACADRSRELAPGELLSDYYLSRGYPAGQWFGAGAEHLGLSGAVTPAQMNALFGEGRHPNADAIEAEMITGGATAEEALNATRLGRRFPQYSALDHLRSQVSQAYKDHNRLQGRPIGAPISAATRAEIRRGVQLQAYRTAHDGDSPADDKELNGWLSEQKRNLKSAVSGVEAVFSYDKTLSIAWAAASPDGRKRIVGMARQAALDTVTYMERNIAYTRRGNIGEAQVDVNGITAAMFEHWDSRAGDPHLHFHVLISSKVQRSDDGEWTALDLRTMFAATVTSSEYFDNRLRDLFREQGANWVQRGAEGVDMKRPVWQLEAVPVELVKLFSQRHRQFEAARAKRIVEFTAKHGKEPTPKDIFAIDRAAQYDNRPGKQPPKTLPEHLKAWREHALSIVPAKVLDTLADRVFLSGRAEPDAFDIAKIAQATRDVVSDNYSHFSWWNLAAEAHRQTAHLTVPVDKREQLVDDVVDTILAQPDTLAVVGPTVVNEPASLRRRDGESVFVEHRSTRYTTTATLAAEGDLVAWAHRGGGHRLRVDTVEKALAGQKLNAGQTEMVRQFARSGRRLQLALAPAGAGKTSAMKVLATAWRRTGHRVYAFGPSARAAQELGASIGAKPHTLHQLTTALRIGFAHRAFPMEAGDLVIVDEAAMAGTHTLHKAVKYALKNGADVRLIGDDAQLAAVEAGGAIRLIAHDVGAVRFREIVRFRGDDRKEQAAASLQIRAWNPKGLKYYFESGRVSDGSLERMRDAARANWQADLDAGVQSLLIVPTNEDTVALNIDARERRLNQGAVDRGCEVELHDATTASVGDWVVTRHNQRLLSLFGGKDFVKNGDVWTVTAVHASGKITVQHRVHKAAITLPAGYVQAHVELAYAATINRVQGMTSTGNAHLLVPPTMTREQFYPGITRAMLGNYLYVVTHHHVIDQHRETPEPVSPRSVLTGVLNHSGAEVSATETMREAQDEAVSMGTLVLRYNYTATYRDEDRYRAILAHRAPSTLDLDSEPALIQTLRNAHDLGWEPDPLVSAVMRWRQSLDDADNPGAALQDRIRKHLEHRKPPSPTAPPLPADITRWRGIVDAIAPHVAVEDPAWDTIWHRAAGALAVGFNIDAALTVVAHQLAARPAVPDPMPDDRYADAALAAELDRRGERGEAHVRAVPWLSRPDFAHVRHHPGHAQYLHEMNRAIADRVEHLRSAVIREQPEWVSGLGPRPDNPIAAEAWDDLVGLAAAYRETFRIDGEAPLGAKPDSRGARAHAWRTLTERWESFGQSHVPAPSAPTQPRTAAQTTELDEVFAEFEQVEERVVLEPLNVLLRRYELLARDGDEDRYLDVLARYVPDAVNAGAEPAALNALANAQDRGWQADRLVRDLVDDRGFSWAEDPAAVLAKRINDHVRTHDAPARIAPATHEQIGRWQQIVAAHLPDAVVTEEQWGVVWRHAAGGATRGLDPDTALTDAARQTAATTTGAEHTAPRKTGIALVSALVRQHDAGTGHHSALPWQARPDLAHTANYRGSLERLATMNAEITARTDQLRDQVVREQPPWLARFGARPDDAALAQQWDQVVGLAAAYRETYGITTADATSPLGNQPAGNDLRADAWRDITQQWRHLMTTPDHEDAASDVMLTRESRRDAADAYAARFYAELAAEKEEDEEGEADAAAATRRTELEDELVDGHDHSYGESSHHGLSY